MEESTKTRPSAFAFASHITNALTCLWGAAAGYILCYSFLVTRNMRFATAAGAALLAVWATLERKRWGRLALMGLSLTTIGVFTFLLGAFAAFGTQVQPQVQSLGNTLRSLAALYDISAVAVVGMLLLAAVTGLWMLTPDVTAEFNHNKSRSIAGAQRGIALALVCCWAAAIAQTPLLMAGKANGASGKRPVFAGPRMQSPLRHSRHTLNSLPILSAPSLKSK